MTKEEKKEDKKEKESFKVISPPKTLGQKAADFIAKWAGSWYFIIIFLIFLGLWMIINTTWIIFGRAWDIYPFIL